MTLRNRMDFMRTVDGFYAVVDEVLCFMLGYIRLRADRREVGGRGLLKPLHAHRHFALTVFCESP